MRPVGVAASFLLISSPFPARASALAQEAVLVFTRVTVIDGTDSVPRRDRTVIIRGNRIVAVAAAESAAVPAGARVVDGRDKYLVPGFWDMHVHSAVPGGRDLLALFVANGVTGVRDMGSDLAPIKAWRAEIAAGTLVGPRIIASGPYIEGGEVGLPHLVATTSAEARIAVDSLVRLGADFVKLHSQFNREVYFAAARAARSRHMVFAGHVPRVVTAEEASDSGQRSIEHLLQIPIPCTSSEAARLKPRFIVQTVLGQCTDERLAPLFAKFVRNGTWIVPTLTAVVEIAGWPGHSVPGDSLARYLPDTLRQFVTGIFPMPEGIPPGADSVGRALLAKRLALVGDMHRAGVRILPGTDSPLRNSPPGFGLHEELVMFSRAGLSPFEILRAATLEPARYFGAQDTLGTIAPGKVADLVLLEADPLQDIRNARRVAAVVANGKLMDEGARAALLEELIRRGAEGRREAP